MVAQTACILLGLAAAHAFQGPVPHQLGGVRHAQPKMNFFDDLFKKDEAAEARKEADFRAQQEILNRRRNPAAGQVYRSEMAERRRAANKEAAENINWQRKQGVDPLVEFRKRQEAGKLKKMGYEDEPKGGAPPDSLSYVLYTHSAHPH
eukprot:6304363-Prymnesium_polylepis.1